MAEPGRVADCVAAMTAAVGLPVTVKCRIGIDDREDYGFLHDFVATVAAAGCEVFVIHARKAMLSGLSPKQNREVPPLRYEYVHRVKRDFPQLTVVVNGGIRDLDAVRVQLSEVDGVMIGREAYQNPWFLAAIEKEVLGGSAPEDRAAVVRAWIPYIQQQLAAGQSLSAMSRHGLGLFAGQPGARAWRRTLSELAPRSGAGCRGDRICSEPDRGRQHRGGRTGHGLNGRRRGYPSHIPAISQPYPSHIPATLRSNFSNISISL